MKKAVIFDLDGTLLDTLYDLYEAVNFAMKKHSYPERTLAEVRKFVGNGVRVLIERALPDGKDTPDFEDVLCDFKEYYSVHSRDNTKPYDGIEELLVKLGKDGIKSAIVSNKFDKAVQELKDEYFKGLIDFACGENEKEGIRKKPFPDSTFRMLEKLGVLPEEAVFVGDSDVDKKTADNAGVEAILVTWGFRDKSELMKTGQKVFCDNTTELYDAIRRK